MDHRDGPEAGEARFAAYVERLAQALGHADRAAPLKAYCTGLILPGERKSIEPMAARLEPARVQAAHQSLHHFVAKANWSDEALLALVRAQILPEIERQSLILAWIVDDTGFPIAYRLYLPERWAEDRERRAKAGVPEGVAFRTKPEIALDQIRSALAA